MLINLGRDDIISAFKGTSLGRATSLLRLCTKVTREVSRRCNYAALSMHVLISHNRRYGHKWGRDGKLARLVTPSAVHLIQPQ